MRRTSVVVVAWTHVPSRQKEIADALGAANVTFSLNRNLPAPVRYFLFAARTAGHLLWRQPTAVLVTCPPIPCAVLVALLAPVLRYRFVLDSHPGAFGLMGDVASARLQFVHEWLISRAAGTAVTTEGLAGRARLVGKNVGLVHEAPPKGEALASARKRAGRPSVLLAAAGGRDEPYGLFIDVVSDNPDIGFVLTGRREPAKEALRSRAIPENLQMVGFIDADAFAAQIEKSDAVIVLSTEPDSVMRTAYEAVYHERPLVVTDTQATRRFFAFAAHVDNDRTSVSQGLRTALTQANAELAAASRSARTVWADQLAWLQQSLGLV